MTRPDLVELPISESGEVIERTREETEAALIEGFRDKTRAERWSWRRLQVPHGRHTMSLRSSTTHICASEASFLCRAPTRRPADGRRAWEFGAVDGVMGARCSANTESFTASSAGSETDQDRLRRDGGI
jgi:hypothetical protein